MKAFHLQNKILPCSVLSTDIIFADTYKAHHITSFQSAPILLFVLEVFISLNHKLEVMCVCVCVCVCVCIQYPC